MKRWPLRLAIASAVIFAVIQFVPVKRTNPPVEVEVAWDSPRTRELFFRACADCHSNETVWPWYSHVAPVSWAVIKHVRDGRHELNISVPDDEVDTDDVADEIREGKMSPAYYTLTHREARLSEQEKTDLISGMRNTFD